MSQTLIPKGGNDLVYTPDELAQSIINHFNPKGYILDPCKGRGAFLYNFPEDSIGDWAELSEGRNFLTFDGYITKHFDWAITNPPWSQFRPFLNKSMELADNVVFLCLINAFFMKARLRDMQEKSFGIKEILHIKDTPPKPWPQAGIALGAVHIKRDWAGDIKFSTL